MALFGSVGLFHRAIMQSGSALSPWAIANDVVRYSRQLTESVGCPIDRRKSPAAVVDCLRQKPVEDLLQVHQLKVPTHLISFGPTIDGIVIPNDPLTLMSDPSSLFGSYDLLFGITRQTGSALLNNADYHYGMDSWRRDRILRTLVRNLYSYHLQEIFATIVNEYTDWSQAKLHPVHLADSVVDALTDALIVAPTVKSGSLHSKLDRATYFYALLSDHVVNSGSATVSVGRNGEQVVFIDSASMATGGGGGGGSGSVHLLRSTSAASKHTSGSGLVDELVYTLGAPLVAGLDIATAGAHRNYTQSQISVSQTIMQYLINFIKSG